MEENKNISSFMCRSVLEDMFTCEWLKLEKEIERTKKHIELGHRGSAIEPRNYEHELQNLLKQRDMLLKTYEYLKSKCSDEKLKEVI